MSSLNKSLTNGLNRIDNSDRSPVCSLSEKYFLEAFQNPDKHLKKRVLNLQFEPGGTTIKNISCLQKNIGEYPTVIVIDDNHPELNGCIATEYFGDTFLVLRKINIPRLQRYIDKDNNFLNVLPDQIQTLVDNTLKITK